MSKYDAINPSPGYVAARIVERKRPQQLVEVDLNNPESWVAMMPAFIAAMTSKRDDTALICEVIKSRAHEVPERHDDLTRTHIYEEGDLIVLKEFAGAKFTFEDDTIVMCQPRDIAGKLNLETGSQEPS